MDTSSLVNFFWAVASACAVGGFVIFKYRVERSDRSRIEKIEIIEGLLSQSKIDIVTEADDSATSDDDINPLRLSRSRLCVLLAETQISAAYGTSISLSEMRTLLLAESPDKALTEYAYSDRFLKVENGNIYRKYEFENDKKTLLGKQFSLSKYIHQLMGLVFFAFSICINYSILSTFDSIDWHHPLSGQIFSLTFFLGAIPMSLLFIFFGAFFVNLGMKYPTTKFLKGVFGDLFVETDS